LWHYLDIESAFDDILSKTTVTVLAPYNEAALDIAIQMASGVKQVVTSNGGQAQLKKGTGMDGQMSWKWAKVFSPAPKPDVTSLIEEMISQAEGGLGSDVKSEVAKYLFDNIKTATSPLNVETKSRNLNNNYKPTIFYPAPLPIVHWTQVVSGDSGGSNGSNGSSSSGAPSALPLVGAATSSDVLTLRTGPTAPTALQAGAQLRVTILVADDSGDDSYGDPVDDNVGDQDPVVVKQRMAGLRGRPDQTRGGQMRGRRGRALKARGLGAYNQREYTFDVTQVSGPYSNGTVEVQVKGQVPGPLSQAVSDTRGPVAARILAAGDGSGGSDNGSNGGSDDGSGGSSDEGSNGDSGDDNNASIGPGAPSPQRRNKFVSGVSNVTVFTAGGVLLTGLLAALFDEDPLPPRRRR